MQLTINAPHHPPPYLRAIPLHPSSQVAHHLPSHSRTSVGTFLAGEIDAIEQSLSMYENGEVDSDSWLEKIEKRMAEGEKRFYELGCGRLSFDDDSDFPEMDNVFGSSDPHHHTPNSV